MKQRHRSNRSLTSSHQLSPEPRRILPLSRCPRLCKIARQLIDGNDLPDPPDRPPKGKGGGKDGKDDGERGERSLVFGQLSLSLNLQVCKYYSLGALKSANRTYFRLLEAKAKIEMGATGIMTEIATRLEEGSWVESQLQRALK